MKGTRRYTKNPHCAIGERSLPYDRQLNGLRDPSQLGKAQRELKVTQIVGGYVQKTARRFTRLRDHDAGLVRVPNGNRPEFVAFVKVFARWVACGKEWFEIPIAARLCKWPESVDQTLP